MDVSELQPHSDIASFRQFNRAYTQFIGTLKEGLLSTPFSLAEARVLYELATRARTRAKEICSALDLDAGYLSRILSKFEAQGLLQRKSSKQDSRAAELELTRKGRAAFDKLNALSDKQARSMLEKLPPSERSQVIGCMRMMERYLLNRGQDARRCTLRPHGPGDMGWIVYREATVYAEEYGWDNTFELLVLEIVADFVRNFDAQRERCWIAEIDSQNIGHVFLVKDRTKHNTAKLRLLLVEPSARGQGVGRVLVNECIRFARAVGYRKITLWTQSILSAAHRIYEQAGFRLVKEEPHHSFGKDLIGQTWEIELVSSTGG